MITKWNAQQLESQIREKLASGLYVVGNMMIADTKQKMASQQGPSPPGGYPAVDTARLMNNLAIEVDKSNLILRFGSDITDPPYPYWLEIGTPKMAARPWLRPCLAWIRPQVMPILKSQMRGVI